MDSIQRSLVRQRVVYRCLVAGNLNAFIQNINNFQWRTLLFH
jgi:hypothetical protein